MSRSAIRDAEHRRGMVLGFTLAEALLLLLFILILALGAQLTKVNNQLAATPDEDKVERLRLEKKLKQFAPLLQEAEKIDPSNPPEVLRRGLTFARKFGANVQPNQLHVATSQLAAVLDEISKLDPDSPPEHLIKRSLEILRKVGPETPTDQVQRVPPELGKVIAKANQIAPNDPVGALQEGLDKVGSTNTAMPEASKGKHDWPPIINLSEADGYFFTTGSADLSPMFQTNLSQIVIKRLLDIVHEYDVNVIEVVGHTDEQPLSGRPSNLDKLVFPFLSGQSPEKFTPSDNAGLGFARAVAVLKFLRDDRRLTELQIIPLSGAQLTDLGDQLSKGGTTHPVEQRRRIEIRVRRSDAAAPQAAPHVLLQPVPDAGPRVEPTAIREHQGAPQLPPSTIAPREAHPQGIARQPAPARPWEKPCSGIEQWSEQCR